MMLLDVGVDVVVPGWEEEDTTLEDEDNTTMLLEVLELRVEDGSVDELERINELD